MSLNSRSSLRFCLPLELFTGVSDSIVSFIRETESQRMLIIHNLSGEEQEVSVSDEEEIYKLYYADSEDVSFDTEDDSLIIPPYSSVILK